MSQLPEFIVVDDVPRPTTNSLGQPIHPTEEGIRNFWTWFGSAKCVDELGRPRVCYHGVALTNEQGRELSATGYASLPFDEFKESRWSGAFFFSEDRDWARDFASEKASRALESDYEATLAVYVKVSAPFDPADPEHVARLLRVSPDRLPVYNRYAGDAGQMICRDDVRVLLNSSQNWTFIEANTDLLRAAGFDGAFQRERQATIAAFSSSQIKSATHNSGLFSVISSSLTDASVSPQNAAYCEIEHPGEFPAGVGLSDWRKSVLREQWRCCAAADSTQQVMLEAQAKRIGTYAPHEELGMRVDGRLADFHADAVWHDVAYRDPTEATIKRLSTWLRANPENCVRLYHGTAAGHDITHQGLLPTDRRRKGGAHSLQTRSGFVSLSIYPGMAERFARMAYPGQRVAIYAVDVPVKLLVPDADQLKNKRAFAQVTCGSSLADSLCHGHGAQIKGKVDPWRITYLGPTEDFIRQAQPSPLATPDSGSEMEPG